MAKIAKKGPNFTHIRPQKNNFAQIEHLHWAKLKYTPFLTLKGGVFQFGPVYHQFQSLNQAYIDLHSTYSVVWLVP